jgi:cell division protein FtsB
MDIVKVVEELVATTKKLTKENKKLTDRVAHLEQELFDARVKASMLLQSERAGYIKSSPAAGLWL